MSNRTFPHRNVAPTIARVAKEAKVSRATVSRAFGAPHMLNAATVEMVRAVAARLGYVPNQTARALSTGRTGNIALVVPDITNPFFAALMRGAQARAREAGFAIFLGDSDELPTLEDELLTKLAAQVEGFVLVSPRSTPARIRDHASRRPLVLVNSDVEGLTRLLVDTGPSYARAVEYLAKLGHRRIAYVAGPARSWSNGQRLAALMTAANALGLDVTVVPTARPSFDAGRACAERLVAEGATAALAFDDCVAQGKLVVSDAHEGIKAAVAKLMNATWQRCRDFALAIASVTASIFDFATQTCSATSSSVKAWAALRKWSKAARHRTLPVSAEISVDPKSDAQAST